MLSTGIGAWLAKEGIGLLLGALGKLALGFYEGWRADQAAKRAEQNAEALGRVSAERDQEQAGREATQRELEALRNAPQSADDAIARLEGGTA